MERLNKFKTIFLIKTKFFRKLAFILAFAFYLLKNQNIIFYKIYLSNVLSSPACVSLRILILNLFLRILFT